jgi:hypothetical protein
MSLSFAASQNASSISIPIHRRPVASQAAAVVPLPIQLSRTVSRGCVYVWINHQKETMVARIKILCVVLLVFFLALHLIIQVAFYAAH